jgi:hypothetical protein
MSDALLDLVDADAQSKIKSGTKECLKLSDCTAFATCVDNLQAH